MDKESSSACQILRKNFHKLSTISLPFKVSQLLYTERDISKETFDEIHRSGGLLTDGPLKELSCTVSEDPNKLRVITAVLQTSKETIHIGKEMLKEYSKWLIFIKKLLIIIFHRFILTSKSVRYRLLIIHCNNLLCINRYYYS